MEKTESGPEAKTECLQCRGHEVIKCRHYDGLYLVHHRQHSSEYYCFGQEPIGWLPYSGEHNNTRRDPITNLFIDVTLDAPGADWDDLEAQLLAGTLKDYWSL